MSVNKKNGFTLIELMVALAVGGMVLAVLVGVFSRASRLYTLENSRAELQQEMRATLEIMARDIRMAAYDPKKSGKFKVKKASATHLRFTTDFDEDGDVDSSPSFPDCEVISYRYAAATQSVQLICGEGTGSLDVQTLIGDTTIDVTALDFNYRKNDGTTTTFANDIRGVVITLTAEIPAGRDGMESRTYSTWVDLRNAGPNSSI